MKRSVQLLVFLVIAVTQALQECSVGLESLLMLITVERAKVFIAVVLLL